MIRALAFMISVLAIAGTTIYGLSVLRAADPHGVGYRDTPAAKDLPPQVDWYTLRGDLAIAVHGARETALQSARAELEQWHGAVMGRVDADFLPWYFGYWQSQKRAAAYMWDWMIDDQQAATLKAADRLSDQLAARALPPYLTDRALEQIAVRAAELFASALRDELDQIPERYAIPPADWERFLGGLSFTMAAYDDQAQMRMADVSLKALVSGGAVVAGLSLSQIATRSVSASFTRMAAAMGQRAAASSAAIAGRAVARSAVNRSVAQVGSGVAARGGVRAAGSLGGPLVAALTIGVVGAWEYLAHTAHVEEHQPRMRAAIEEFLVAFEEDLMRADGAIGAPVHQIETGLYKALGGQQ